MYDIIQEKQPDIVLLDFWKAYVTIEWDFLNKHHRCLTSVLIPERARTREGGDRQGYPLSGHIFCS